MRRKLGGIDEDPGTVLVGKGSQLGERPDLAGDVRRPGESHERGPINRPLPESLTESFHQFVGAGRNWQFDRAVPAQN